MMWRALALLAVLAAPVYAERVCFSGPLPPTAIGGPRNVIAGSGGVIVGAETMPDWRFRDVNRVVRPQVVVVAPGLAIYHPPPTAGVDVVLENTNHDAVATRKRELSIEEPPPAPVVESIVVTGGLKTRKTVVGRFKQIPKNAVVAIVSRIERDDRVVPIVWAQVGGQPNNIELWRAYQQYSCDQTITKWVEPAVDDRVVITWVDDAGRLSEPSKPIVISGASRRK
jgi:hypothetical protein